MVAWPCRSMPPSAAPTARSLEAGGVTGIARPVGGTYTSYVTVTSAYDSRSPPGKPRSQAVACPPPPPPPPPPPRPPISYEQAGQAQRAWLQTLLPYDSVTAQFKPLQRHDVTLLATWRGCRFSSGHHTSLPLDRRTILVATTHFLHHRITQHANRRRHGTGRACASSCRAYFSPARTRIS